jgi:hypothetical protein
MKSQKVRGKGRMPVAPNPKDEAKLAYAVACSDRDPKLFGSWAEALFYFQQVRGKGGKCRIRTARPSDCANKNHQPWGRRGRKRR